jgi:hypothetical protein
MSGPTTDPSRAPGAEASPALNAATPRALPQALPLRIEWAPDPGAITAAIGDERLVGLYTFWLGLDTFPLLPASRAIVPGELLRIWPNVAITAPEGRRMRYGMLGGDVVAQLGADASGRFIDEVAGGTRLALLEALYELCREARAAVYARTLLAAPGEEVVAHRLLLPFSDDGRTVETILCGQTHVRVRGGTVGAYALRERDEAECHAWVDAAQAAATHLDGADALDRSAARGLQSRAS